MAPVPTHPSDRFWKHATPGEPDECWEWQGARYKTGPARGYGFIHAGALYHTGQRIVKAHRLSWEMHNGRVLSPGENVLHHCDNPPCVNPAHLYVGTKSQNAQDRESRGRGREVRGENNDNAKLTEIQVLAIIAELRLLPRRSQASIAADFGVKQPQVSRIMRRENWGHLWG